MKLFLGIDGGQTSTKSILADESGRIVGSGVGGPSKHLKDENTREHAREALYQAIHEALVQAGLPDSQEIDSAFLGITGVASPEAPVAIVYREVVEQQFEVKKIAIDHDAHSALAGAIPSRVGVIVIAGTGSIAFGMNQRGESARAGGWGYLLGDQGSAFEIGRRALIAVGQEWDGLGPKTALTPFILESFQIEDAGLIPQVIYRDPLPKLRIASVSRLATQAAQSGDPIAQSLFHEGGKGLGEIACVVIRKLHLQDRPITVSGVGGIFQSGELIWKPYRDQVLLQHPKAAVTSPRFAPLLGALLLAFKSGGVPISPRLLQQLERCSL